MWISFIPYMMYIQKIVPRVTWCSLSYKRATQMLRLDHLSDHPFVKSGRCNLTLIAQGCDIYAGELHCRSVDLLWMCHDFRTIHYLSFPRPAVVTCWLWFLVFIFRDHRVLKRSKNYCKHLADNIFLKLFKMRLLDKIKRAQLFEIFSCQHNCMTFSFYKSSWCIANENGNIDSFLSSYQFYTFEFLGLKLTHHEHCYSS